MSGDPGAPVLLHLVDRNTLHDATSHDRRVLEPDSLDAVGFVHLSTPSQIAIAANRHFPGRTDLVLLVLDPGRLGAVVRWEAGTPPEGDLRFPHLYGPLPLAAVTAAVDYQPGADGRFRDPELP